MTIKLNTVLPRLRRALMPAIAVLSLSGMTLLAGCEQTHAASLSRLVTRPRATRTANRKRPWHVTAASGCPVLAILRVRQG